MSRIAKTRRQHLLEGTLPQGKANLDSRYPGGRPHFPKHLSPEARKEFKRAVRFLERRGTVTEGDYGTLTIYATVFSRWLQAKEEVGRELMVEVTVTDNNGIAHKTRRLNPLLKVLEACESRLLALTKSLGLTPLDRDRIKPAAPAAPVADEIIPGSMAWYDLQATKKEPLPFVIPLSEMLADNSEPEENTDVEHAT